MTWDALLSSLGTDYTTQVAPFLGIIIAAYFGYQMWHHRTDGQWTSHLFNMAWIETLVLGARPIMTVFTGLVGGGK